MADDSVEVTFVDQYGAETVFSALFDNPDQLRYGDFDTPSQIKMAQLHCPAEDVPENAAVGDEITVASVDYKIKSILSDGQGWMIIGLERTG